MNICKNLSRIQYFVFLQKIFLGSNIKNLCKNLSQIQYFEYLQKSLLAPIFCCFAGASQVLLHNGTTSPYGRAEGEAAGYKVLYHLEMLGLQMFNIRSIGVYKYKYKYKCDLTLEVLGLESAMSKVDHPLRD